MSACRKHIHWTKSRIKEERGWTEAMIRDLLKEPDKEAPNPHFKTSPSMKKYLIERVLAAEESEEFKTKMKRLEAIRARRAEREAARALLNAAKPPAPLPKSEMFILGHQQVGDFCLNDLEDIARSASIQVEHDHGHTYGVSQNVFIGTFDVYCGTCVAIAYKGYLPVLWPMEQTNTPLDDLGFWELEDATAINDECKPWQALEQLRKHSTRISQAQKKVREKVQKLSRKRACSTS